MTTRVGDVLVIEKEAPSACEDCGQVAELRPFGPGGSRICFQCGKKDLSATRARMAVHFASLLRGGVSKVVGAEGQILDVATGTVTSGKRGSA